MAVSAAWRSESSRRQQNDDLAHFALGDDGSWLVAVADGSGAHRDGRGAAVRAIWVLPRRISGADAMHRTFRRCHKAVTKAASLRNSFSEPLWCPATTLSVAACTPEGGVVVGIAGDTRVALLWCDDDGWHGRPVGRLHRDAEICGHLLRQAEWSEDPTPMEEPQPYPVEVYTEEDIGMPAAPIAVGALVASHGAWSAFPGGSDCSTADAIAAVLDTNYRDARDLSGRVTDAVIATRPLYDATIALAMLAPHRNRRRA